MKLVIIVVDCPPPPLPRSLSLPSRGDNRASSPSQMAPPTSTSTPPTTTSSSSAAHPPQAPARPQQCVRPVHYHPLPSTLSLTPPSLFLPPLSLSLSSSLPHILTPSLSLPSSLSQFLPSLFILPPSLPPLKCRTRQQQLDELQSILSSLHVPNLQQSQAPPGRQCTFTRTCTCTCLGGSVHVHSWVVPGGYRFLTSSLKCLTIFHHAYIACTMYWYTCVNQSMKTSTVCLKTTQG